MPARYTTHPTFLRNKLPAANRNEVSSVHDGNTDPAPFNQLELRRTVTLNVFDVAVRIVSWVIVRQAEAQEAF